MNIDENDDPKIQQYGSNRKCESNALPQNSSSYDSPQGQKLCTNFCQSLSDPVWFWRTTTEGALCHHCRMVSFLSLLALAIIAAGPRPVRAPGCQTGDNGTTAILIGAGDINDCGNPEGAESTAKILEAYPTATILPTGDLAYFSGSNDAFRCYDKTWGRPSQRERTRPAVGNHECVTWGAAAFFRYWRKAREAKAWEITGGDLEKGTTVTTWAPGTWS
jgi:hypothetical protein